MNLLKAGSKKNYNKNKIIKKKIWHGVVNSWNIDDNNIHLNYD